VGEERDDGRTGSPSLVRQNGKIIVFSHSFTMMDERQHNNTNNNNDLFVPNTITTMGENEASLREPFMKPRWISTESYGFVLLLLSAVTYSGMGCFLKLASATGLPSTQLVFFRATFQGFFVIIGLIVFRAKTEAEGGKTPLAEGENERTCTVPHGPRTTNRLICSPFGGTSTVRKIVLARGCVGGLGFVLYFYTISVLPLGDAVTLLSMYPIITIFFARIFLGEIARTTHLLAAVASITGALLIARPRFLFGGSVDDDPDASGGVQWFGYVTAALGSCAGSAVFILIRKAGTVGAHTLQLLFSWVCFGTIFSLAFGILQSKHNGEWRLPPSRTSWMYVLGLCSIGSAAHFLMNYAGRLTPAGLASITRSSGLMWAYMFEVLIFKEVPKASTIVGVVLIVMSLVAITLQKVRDERLTSVVASEKLPTLEQDNDQEAEIELGVNKGGDVTSKVNLHSRYWKVPVVDDDEKEWDQ
jgi:drug/metabolite transporter (DMT)-like permease